MPVVLSYNDIGALGALAFQTGQAQGAVHDQARVDGLIQNRQRQDTERMRLETARQQAEADRRLQARLAGDEQDLRQQQYDDQRQYRYDALGQDQAQFDARLSASREQALIGAQGDLAAQLVKAQTQAERDKRLHGYKMAEIEAKGTRDASGALISPEGVPTKKHAEQEVQKFGNLIPYGASDAFNAEDAGRKRQQAAETAQNFAQLPTGELLSYIKQKPSDKWSPFLRAVVQARQSATGGGGAGGGNVGAVPEGGSFAGWMRGTAQDLASLRGDDSGALSRGGGLTGGSLAPGADPRLQGLTDEELNALANDPALIEKFYGGASGGGGR